MAIDAWSIDDNAGFGPPGHDGVYGVVLSSDQILRAENSGWRYSVHMRIVDSELGATHDSITSFVITSDSAYSMQFGRSANGKPLVMLTTGEDVGPVVEVDDASNGYHLYELIYSPADDATKLFIDGSLRAVGYTGRPSTGDLDLGNPFGAVGNVSFGSTSNNFTGQANYNFVEYEIVPEPSTAILALFFAFAWINTRREKGRRSFVRVLD
jgi:hypothetical protein